MKRPLFYVLDGKKPVPCDSPLPCAELLADGPARLVGYNVIDRFRVSTVFLCFDHAFMGKPKLFETAVLEGDDLVIPSRYSTWAQAEEGHKEVVEHLTLQVQFEREDALRRLHFVLAQITKNAVMKNLDLKELLKCAIKNHKSVL